MAPLARSVGAPLVVWFYEVYSPENFREQCFVNVIQKKYLDWAWSSMITFLHTIDFKHFSLLFAYSNYCEFCLFADKGLLYILTEYIVP